MNLFTFATLAACNNAIFPSQSMSFTFKLSVGRPVEASITAVIPLKDSGSESVILKSTITYSAPHSRKKLAFRI